MAKGFKAPSFSMPSIPKIPEVKAAAINFATPKIQAAKDSAAPKLQEVKDMAIDKLQKRGIPTDMQSAMNKFEIPDIPGVDTSSLGDMREYLNQVEMPKLSDLKPDKSQFKIPTFGELKDMAKNKVGDVKDIIKDYRANGAEALIPKDLKDMGMELGDLGVSPKDMIKNFGKQIKSGEGFSMDSFKDLLSGAPDSSGIDYQELLKKYTNKED